MTGLTQHLGSQAALLFSLLWVAARSPLQEPGQGSFSRIAIQRVGSLLELNAVEEPLNVARDRVLKCRSWRKGRYARQFT
jgi:hypothetical protein